MSESLIPSQGEEWRDMYGGNGVYDADAQQDVLQRAKDNIEIHRKRAVELRVIDHAGTPRAGVPVRLVLRRHAFAFGDQTAELERFVRYRQMDTDKARQWQRRFDEVFNASNHLCYWTEREQNDLCKTETQQGRLILDDLDRTIAWGERREHHVKGHPLYWSIPKCVPDWVQRYDYPTQLKFTEVRVRNLLARFRGRVGSWDMINEALWEARLENLATRHWPHLEPVEDLASDISTLLSWCREEDPSASYIVNDYGMVGPDLPRGPANDGSMVTASIQRQRMVELMAALSERGSLPDGLGMQSHTGLIEHDVQWRCYDQLAQAGLPLQVTEFWCRDADVDPEGTLEQERRLQLQADYVENYLTCAFGHPKITCFYFWGFLDWAIDWRKEGEHELRPVFDRIRTLIRDRWHTEETLVTDAKGIASSRVFTGRYVIQIGDLQTIVDIDASQEQPLTLTV